MKPLELEETIVKRIDEVRGGCAGLTAADAAVVEHDDRLPNLGKQVRSGEAGDAGADDAHISRSVGRQG